MKFRYHDARRRRGARTAHIIYRSRIARLSVHRTARHIYAQLIDPQARILASASTVEREVREKFPAGNTIAAANAVGERLANKIKTAKLDVKCAFDRSGFRYHGRIKALAESARSCGLEF